MLGSSDSSARASSSSVPTWDYGRVILTVDGANLPCTAGLARDIERRSRREAATSDRQRPRAPAWFGPQGREGCKTCSRPDSESTSTTSNISSNRQPKYFTSCSWQLRSRTTGASFDGWDVVLRDTEVMRQPTLGQAPLLPHCLQTDSAHLNLHSVIALIVCPSCSEQRASQSRDAFRETIRSFRTL